MTSDAPTFSLIFLTWNAEDSITKSFSTLLEQSYGDFEVVIVDNGSTDNTISSLHEYKSCFQMKVIENHVNLGFTKGINRGIEASEGDYICCYNHDTHFEPDYLSTLASYITPDTVWTTARLNYRTSKEHRCVRLLEWDGFPVPYIVDELEGTFEVNYVPGDGLIVPRAVYEKLEAGIFDPSLPPKGEDVDLSLRLQQRGIPMKAIVDTYSVHPDEGQYDLTTKNALNHIKNVWARFLAYRNVKSNLMDIFPFVASAVTVPWRILIGRFPRDAEDFERRTLEH